jgi:hypothetical protein
MKNFSKLISIIALVAVIGFSFAACGGDDSGGGGGPQTATYTGTSSGMTYTLKITENTARYTAQSGDNYELTGDTKKSAGKVDIVSGDVLTLRPTNAATTFTATVSGNSITGFTGSVIWDGESTPTSLPSTLTGGNQGGNSNAGVLTFTDGIFTTDGNGSEISTLCIIANNTDTSGTNWKDNATVIARYNFALDNQKTTETTLPIRFPGKSMTVANEYDSILATATVFTGSGTYAIYLKYLYWESFMPYRAEKILKNVTFNNGCATVRSSDFITISLTENW